MAEPQAAIDEVLLAGVVPDLRPPPPPVAAAAAGQVNYRMPSPALVLPTALQVLTRRPDETKLQVLANLVLDHVLGGQSVDMFRKSHPEFSDDYLPRLLGFLRERLDRITELNQLVDEVSDAMRERTLGEARDHAIPDSAVTRDLALRLQLGVTQQRAGLALEVDRRRARDIVWGRDLHVPGSPAVLERLPVFGRLNPPVATLAEAYSGMGISTVERGEGGVVRQQRLVFRVDGGASDPGGGAARLAFHAALPAIAYLRGLDLDHVQMGADFLRIPGSRGAKDLVVPIDAGGRTLLDYRGKWREDGFDYVSGAEVLDLLALWRERDRCLATEPVHAQRAVVAGAVERWCAGRAWLAPGAGGALGPALEVAVAATAGWLTADARAYADAQLPMVLEKLSLDTQDMAEAVEEARKSGNAQDLKEASAVLAEKRRWFNMLVTELPLREERLRALVGGRLCLLGVTSTGTTDVSASPLQDRYVNLGVHANLIDQMLRGDFLIRPPWAHVDVWVLLAYLLFVPLVLPLISIRKGAIAVMLLVAFHVVLSSALLVYRGLWIDGSTPLLASVTAYGFITIRRYMMEERQKSRIRSMFQTYLDPRVVEAMIADESVFTEIGGTTREITAFFSDIEGFTTISELLDSDELSLMLQEYLTPMTERILAHGGLRDKYIGDAIVAIFGAPYPSDDHAAQACLAAIEQVERLAELKRGWERDGAEWYRKVRGRGLDLAFRIGLNTGRAKVGNFGSRDAKNYTMIGDAVNLAARLEGANKPYHTRIMISETTYRAAAAVIEVRELDLLRVVGKLQPVKVYEVLGRKDQVDAARLALARRFAEALAIYRARKFDEARSVFAELQAAHPDDGAVATYVKRLEDRAYLASLPPDWDGAFVSKEK